MTTLVDTPQLTNVQRTCLDHYDLGRVEVERELSGGMFSRPLLLQTGQGPFVLRTHTFRATEAAFRFQAEVIQWAFEHGVPCAPIEPTSSSAWCVPLPDGPGVMAVHHYVEGASENWHAWHRRKETESDFLYKLGEHVARMHNRLATAQPSGDADLPIDLPPIRLNRLEEVHAAWQQATRKLCHAQSMECSAARRRLLDLESRIEAHWERLLETVDGHDPAALPRQIVHGDVSAVNIVWGHQNDPVFIDWDAVHYGYRMYDALGDVLNRVPDDRPDWNRYRQDHVKEYLVGYASALEEPLSDQERELIPTFCLARQLEDLRQRVMVLPYLTKEDDQPYARLIGMRVEMMDQIGALLSAGL